MHLQTDEQTIDDLRLFSKKDIVGIYEIYNMACTRGGEALLQDMFRHPLTAVTSIRKRCDIIRHFAQARIDFPFNGSLFDLAEKYFSHPEQTSGRSGQGELGEKDIQNGVAAVLELIQRVKMFISTDAVTNNTSFAPQREEMEGLLSDPVFAPVFRENLKSKLSFAANAAFDNLLRIREREKVKSVLHFVYELDVYISVAQVANKYNFIFPTPLEKGSNELKLEGLYHPALKQPIANDVEMGLSQRVIFLTGANMAGKSTFLRSLSTVMYLAHMGFPVAASKMEFPVMDGIYTTINLPDNLGIGASHFYAEVLRVKKVATELSAGKKLFVVFDELFRGTNVKDAHEATVEVTKAFTSKTASRFIISSHIVEAGEDLQQQKGIGFLYLPTRMNGHTPEYTYRLEQGITGDRHGMIIIQNEKILDILKNGKRNINVTA